MRVVILSGKQRPKPRAGDEKIIRGVKHVRILRPALGPGGRVIGHQVRNGKPLFDWKPVP